MANSKHRATTNIYEGAYLLAKGFKINGKDDSNSKVTMFFEGTGVEHASDRFYKGALVNAKAYAEAFRTLKDYIFER
jgi:hypothetical protein